MLLFLFLPAAWAPSGNHSLGLLRSILPRFSAMDSFSSGSFLFWPLAGLGFWHLARPSLERNKTWGSSCKLFPWINMQGTLDKPWQTFCDLHLS